MRLKSVLQGVSTVGGFANCKIASVELDSRQVGKGSLFIALQGTKADGRKYIPMAIENGAVAIAYDGEYQPDNNSISWIKLAGDMRVNVAKIASNFYVDMPKQISAITGTNGKTSIADFTRQIMTYLGHNSASIGTIGVVSNLAENFETLTTPDSVTLHKILSRLKNSGVEYVSLEASSIGIEQHRLDGLEISVAGFTNFTQDHLDYHHDMPTYLKAKEELFSRLIKQDGVAVLNADIPEYAELSDICGQRGVNFISYGYNGRDIKILSRVPLSSTQELVIKIFGQEYELDLPLIGEFQAMNVLCAMGMVIALNGFNEKIVSYVSRIKGASGRLEFVGQTRVGANVYVDYAHTPDALENVLKAIREHTKGKLWVVFGCGGDRDKTKRPIMGKIANDLADVVVITDDNPRTEDAEQIRKEVASQCLDAYNIGDRIKAIEFAISNLGSDDVLILAGKGHEDGQKVGDKLIPMNDIDEARKAIARLL